MSSDTKSFTKQINIPYDITNTNSNPITYNKNTNQKPIIYKTDTNPNTTTYIMNTYTNDRSINDFIKDFETVKPIPRSTRITNNERTLIKEYLKNMPQKIIDS